MAEKALTAVVQEACVKGVSTLSVDDLVQAMGMTGISKKPGEPAVWRDRREGEGLPRPPHRGRLAASVDRRHLREGTPEWPHRICRGHCRGRRQQ